MKKYKTGWITTLSFLLLIAGGSFVTALTPDKDFSETENRILQQRPALTIKSIADGSYMKDYESYFSDQFFLRDSWISLKTSTERALLHKEINGVFLGKHGYLISRQFPEDYTGKQAEKNQESLVNFITRLSSSYDASHLKVLLAPTAATVLSDYLPPFAPSYDQTIFLKKIKEALPSGYFTDVFPVFSSHKTEEIYYHTDHHWTSYGAYLAYETWANDCGISPDPLSDFEKETVTDSFYGTLQAKVCQADTADTIELYTKKNTTFSVIQNEKEETCTDSMFDRSALSTKDKYKVFLGGNEPFVEIQNHMPDADAKGRRLLLIKDSYANSFVPFAAGHFETVYLADLRYLTKTISSILEEKKITDILVLYNVSSFVTDTQFGKIGL